VADFLSCKLTVRDAAYSLAIGRMWFALSLDYVRLHEWVLKSPPQEFFSGQLEENPVYRNALSEDPFLYMTREPSSNSRARVFF